MPFLPPPSFYAYRHAALYGGQFQNNRCSPEAAPLNAPKPKPLTPTQKLQLLGVPESHAEDILNHLEGDQPYHAGKLINGKVYLITQNDNIYYGNPGNLQKLEGVQAYRTRCVDQQVRKYHTPDGLSFTVSYKNTASVTTKLLCLTVPIPHRKQTHFHQTQV
jgi:hypothetical protein